MCRATSPGESWPRRWPRASTGRDAWPAPSSWRRAIYQVTPLKAACLRHCRSPISFFLHHGGTTIDTPYRATRLGVVHGAFCVGCCWALMAILVAVGTMNLGWMALLTVVIIVEKTLPRGEQLVRVAAVGFALVGAVLLMNPEVIIALT